MFDNTAEDKMEQAWEEVKRDLRDEHREEERSYMGEDDED